MSGYLVVDVETTGLSVEGSHRVVELCAVQVDATGIIESYWSTLVNPGRAIEATFVHGITDDHVSAAPTFRQVAARLLESARGRVLVAHNARFDLAFLKAELARASLPVTTDPPYLCTMEWSARLLDGTSRKLGDCCRLAGIAHRGDHSAEDDAMGAAALLAFYLKERGPGSWRGLLEQARSYEWPSLVTDLEDVPLLRRASTAADPDEWLDRVTSGAERVIDPRVESYVDALEHALLDGVLSAHERADLASLASTLGLADDQLDSIHTVYFASLAAAAWADGVVTWEEQFLLTQVAAALHIPLAKAQEILAEAQDEKPAIDVPTLKLMRGDRVAFSRYLSTAREVWEARASAVGLAPGALTDETRAFITNDPDAKDRRADRARAAGVPVVAEFTFDLTVTDLETRLRARTNALSRP